MRDCGRAPHPPLRRAGGGDPCAAAQREEKRSAHRRETKKQRRPRRGGIGRRGARSAPTRAGDPARGDRESPPPRSGSGRKGWRRGEPRGATEGAAQSEGNGAARASRSAERPRPTEPKGAEKRARERQARARGKKPRGGFLGRDRTSARPNDSAHTEEVPRGRRRAVAVGHTRRRYRPQRGRLGGGQSAAAAVHEMSRTAQPLVQSLTGREPSPIINHGGSSASAGACQPVFSLGAVRRHPAPVRGL